MHCACLRHAVTTGLFAATLFAPQSFAQSTAVKTGEDTRAQLEARAHVADSLGAKEEAFRLRNRLRTGDFEVGDRVFFFFDADGVPPRPGDTLTVQAGKILRLPESLGNLPLAGMLVSEIHDSVQVRASKYYKRFVIRVNPLLRLSVSGAVGRAGFYYLPSDVPLSDLIMRTGGQSPQADLTKVVIRRGESVIWSAADVQSALAEGFTLEQLALQPGDEVVVGSKSNASSAWVPVLQYGLPIVAGALIQFFLRR